MSEVSLPDILVLGAGLSFVLAFLIINQVMLRIILLIGTLLYIWYYAVAADVPLWMAIWVSVANLVANLIGLGILISSRYRFALPRAYSDIYDRCPVFQDLPPGDFRVLMTSARRYKAEADITLTKEHQRGEKLFFIVEGSVQVEKMGQSFGMPNQIFVGEVAYLLNRNSAATTILKAGSEVIEWDFNKLRAGSRKKTRFKLALEALISRDLAQKVSHAVAPTSMQTRAQE
ncbi:MAG: cyclic nucleotide-binding domain-containing protein [Paracoccaceae bacterium]